MLLALVLIAAPVPADFFQPAETAETCLLVAAGASIFVDYMYSTDIKNHPGQFEGNPLNRWLTGRRVPSDMQFLGLSAAGAVLTLGLWRWLPPEIRPWVPALVLGYELTNANHFMQSDYTLVR